jgi:GAF domain-containing protein
MAGDDAVSRRRSEVLQVWAHAAYIHETSAIRLRRSGRDDAAARVERLAAIARDHIEQPVAAAQVYETLRRLRDVAGRDALLAAALDGAITFLGADFGNLQLVDRRTRTLRIAAQHGFSDRFLTHFAVVADDGLACSRAASGGGQSVVVDVELDRAFDAHRDVVVASAFRAVQSTPLIDRAGVLRGVLSTHFREPRLPAPHELRLTETYARHVAQLMARL